MVFTTKSLSGVRPAAVKTSRLFCDHESRRAPDIFPSGHTLAASPSGGPPSPPLARVAKMMDARRPDRHTVPSTVPALRAKISATPPRFQAQPGLSKNKISPRPAPVFEIAGPALNFYAWFPCAADASRRGDRGGEHFGVRLLRWQLLAVVDARWEFCPAFSIVPVGSKYAEVRHCVTLIGRVMTEIIQPQIWRLGRDLSSSATLRRALNRCSLRVQTLRRTGQKSAALDFLDRLWTTATLIPGCLGPDRRRAQTVITLARRCQAGRADPREHFISLDSAIARLTGCVQFANTEPVVSPAGWGCWIPWERYGRQVKEHPSVRLHESSHHFFAREQRLWTASNGAVSGSANCAGVRFPVAFQSESLREFSGCRVRACFDPLTDPITATLELPAARRGYRAGHIIARHVPALALPPSRLNATRRDLARTLHAGAWSCHLN